MYVWYVSLNVSEGSISQSINQSPFRWVFVKHLVAAQSTYPELCLNPTCSIFQEHQPTLTFFKSLKSGPAVVTNFAPLYTTSPASLVAKSYCTASHCFFLGLSCSSDSPGCSAHVIFSPTLTLLGTLMGYTCAFPSVLAASTSPCDITSFSLVGFRFTTTAT